MDDGGATERREGEVARTWLVLVSDLGDRRRSHGLITCQSRLLSSPRSSSVLPPPEAHTLTTAGEAAECKVIDDVSDRESVILHLRPASCDAYIDHVCGVCSAPADAKAFGTTETSPFSRVATRPTSSIEQVNKPPNREICICVSICQSNADQDRSQSTITNWLCTAKVTAAVSEKPFRHIVP